MITSTTRPFTAEEKKQQIKKLPGIYKRFESFVAKLTLIVILLIIPLLIYDHYFPVSSNIQAIYCIATIVVGFMITFWIAIKFEDGLSNKKDIATINSGEVEVVHVKTSRAIKREDFKDFGVAYYLDVIDKGQSKTLFLWGQYLDILEDEKKFPNTEFELIRKKDSDEFIDFKTLGDHFLEEKTLPPFDKEIWKTGVYPINGQLLEQTIDEIK